MRRLGLTALEVTRMLRARSLTKHQRSLAVAAVVAVVAAGSVMWATTLAAQGGSGTSCNGDYVVPIGSSQFGSMEGRLYSNTLTPGWVTTRTYAASIAAGVYDVNAVSYDGYVGRETQSQDNEVWFAEFWGSGGLMATTGTTGDLPDLVAEAFWSGGIGTITLESDATQIVVHHGFLTDLSANSVEPVCLGLAGGPPGPPPTTTEATTTTVVSTSTEAPPTTIVSTSTEAPPPPPPPTPPP
ncbi:MAG: hypothetical protein OEW42_12800, partial [Acidimicrobiia bacterium]|nr:hypothetical protein [Acidimicrobiia bacterium]